MTREYRPEKPEEHDARKAAPYDFDPGCDVKGCQQRGSQSFRCQQCGGVRMLLCGAHAGYLERSLRERPLHMKCGECKAEGPSTGLFAVRPLWAPAGGA